MKAPSIAHMLAALLVAQLAAPPVAAQMPAARRSPATTPPATPAAVAAMGNPQAGQQLATTGAPNGITACAGCHGAQGEGNAAGGFPRIGGQPAYYLARQLDAYANGGRVNPVMQAIAKAMNGQQMRDVAAYYAALGPAATPSGAASTSPIADGAAKGGRRPCSGAASSSQAWGTSRKAYKPAPIVTARAARASAGLSLPGRPAPNVPERVHDRMAQRGAQDRR